MKNTTWIHNLKRPTAWLLCAVTPLFVGCVKGGSLTSGSSSETNSGNITLAKVYPTSAGDSWTPIKLSNKFYVKGNDLTVTGTCSRGVATIKVNEGGADYPETATCDANGNFSWNKVYTAATEVDRTLTFSAYDVGDTAISGSTFHFDVRVDDVAPPVLVVTTPAVTPFIAGQTTSAYSIIGTNSADTVAITFDSAGGTAIVPSGTNWTFPVTLTSGADVIYAFYAHDLAGNVSLGFSQHISWSPTISLKTSSLGSGGGLLISTGNTMSSGYKLEAAIEGYPATDSPGTTSAGVFKLSLGFSNITKFVRGPL